MPTGEPWDFDDKKNWDAEWTGTMQQEDAAINDKPAMS